MVEPEGQHIGGYNMHPVPERRKASEKLEAEESNLTTMSWDEWSRRWGVHRHCELQLRYRIRLAGFALRRWRPTGDYGLMDPRHNAIIVGEKGQGKTLGDIVAFLDGYEPPLPNWPPPANVWCGLEELRAVEEGDPPYRRL